MKTNVFLIVFTLYCVFFMEHFVQVCAATFAWLANNSGAVSCVIVCYVIFTLFYRMITDKNENGNENK